MMLVLTIPQLQPLRCRRLLDLAALLCRIDPYFEDLSCIVRLLLERSTTWTSAVDLAVPCVETSTSSYISRPSHDNITFEDALGRMQSLQFQQFRHRTVFEVSLRCKLDNLPGMRKVLSGEYVLTTPKHRL
jgi:hypothetical protein